MSVYTVYVFETCTAQDFLEPDPTKRLWIRIYSQTLLDRGHLWADVSFSTGRRLAQYLENKGFTVIYSR